MSIFVLFCLAFADFTTLTDAFPRSKDTIQHGVMAIQNGGDTFGVTSMAGVTSNNGKVSSIGDVKFLHPPGMSMTKDGDTMKFEYPLENGMATGFVKMGPGSVMASSSTYNGIPYKTQDINIQPYDLMSNWPMFNDYIFHPRIDIYEPLNYIDPWFKHAMDFAPKPDLRNGWPYHLDPFINLW